MIGRHFITRVPSLYVWWGLFILSIGISSAMVLTPIFAVQHVTCRYRDGGSCGDEVTELLWYTVAGRLWFVRPDAVRRQIESHVHDATVVEVQVHWEDNSVAVVLDRIQPVVYVVTSDSRQGYALGPTGRVLTIVDQLPSDTQELQVITSGLTPYVVGQRVDTPLYRFAVDLAAALQVYGLQPDNVLALTEDEIVLSRGEKRGILSARKDAYEQVWALQLILSQGSSSNSLPIIDVRFDQPVLKPYR